MTRVRRVAILFLFFSMAAFGPVFGQGSRQHGERAGTGGQAKARDTNQGRGEGQAARRGEGNGRGQGNARGQRGEGRGTPGAEPRVYSLPEDGADQASPAAQGRGRGHASSQGVPRGAEPGYGYGYGYGTSQGPGYGTATRRAYPRWQRSEEQARVWQQRRGWAGRNSWQGRNSWEEHRARRWRLEHRTWTERGGYGGFFVPVDRWYDNFGRRHWFHIVQRPVIVEGYPRFYQGGYWWMMVDPWPEYWSDDWYDTDDLYIDYRDGYYLYNRQHPGVELAVSIVF
jgi:hypothetical protein